jgi:hypothetical protein
MMFLATTLGFMLSSTVMLALTIAIFPLLSSAVSVIVFTPISLQSNVVCDMLICCIAQLSVDALFT